MDKCPQTETAACAAVFFGHEDVDTGGRSIAQELRVNDKIRAKEVRLVAPDGQQIGVKGIDEAKWLAAELSLDLVEVAPEARPPVCRLMDYGKYKYEQSVSQREARKTQTRTVIKEVKFRPKIDDHDYQVKMRRARGFLEDSDKVKATLMFRGREITHPELGEKILRRLAEDVKELAEIENGPKLEGRNMTMQLAPLRNRPKQEAPADNEAPAEE
jgi:translation initiation factor IF-3